MSNNRVSTPSPGYMVRYANSQADRWAVYQLAVTRYFPLSLLIGLAASQLIVLAMMISILSLRGWVILIPVIGIILFFGVLHLEIINELFSTNRRLAIALCQDHAVGYALLAIREDYLALLGAYVSPNHRYRGVGRSLVQYAVQSAILPTYLSAPTEELQSFYARLGFVETQAKRGYNMVIWAQRR